MFYRFQMYLSRLLYGRCGLDTLNKAIASLYVLLMFLNLFFRNAVIYLLIWLLFALLLFRMFSKNLAKRQRENNRFTALFQKVAQRHRLQKQRRADKMHVYKKCPHCKATLRLPRKPGKHQVDCPKCRREFSVRIR